METVYRIEHPEIKSNLIGAGPYYLENRYDEIPKELLKVITLLGDAHNISSEHPAIDHDINHDNFNTEDFRLNIISTCPNLDSLFYWFSGFIDDLLNNGLIVVEYKVKQYFKGVSNIQCGFRHKDIISKTIINI